MVIKSQKVGISTSCLIEDFQKAITKCRGKDILIIAQSQEQANEHIHTLKRLIYHSEKYQKYLITSSNKLTFKEEKTKLSEIWIHNPDDPERQTRIIGRGASEGGLWSWKHIAHIHMSDIAANNMKDDSPIFAAAFSRLMSTDGTMVIETPPRGPFKKTFEIYQQSLVKHQDPDLIETQFNIHHVSAQQGVAAGVITQATLDAERARLGATLYAQFYECQFTALTGNLFNQQSIDAAINRPYDMIKISPTKAKIISVDQGYAKSKFAIIVAQMNYQNNRLEILKSEQHELPKSTDMINRIFRYTKEFGNVVNIFVDATAKYEFVETLKDMIGESGRLPYVKERIERAKKLSLDINEMMIVVPFFFTQDLKSFMSGHARRVLDDPRGLIAIDESFIELITGLRSAVFDDRGMLDKELSANDDLIDAFQMLCTYIRFGH